MDFPKRYVNSTFASSLGFPQFLAVMASQNLTRRSVGFRISLTPEKDSNNFRLIWKSTTKVRNWIVEDERSARKLFCHVFWVFFEFFERAKKIESCWNSAFCGQSFDDSNWDSVVSLVLLSVTKQMRNFIIETAIIVKKSDRLIFICGSWWLIEIKN